MERHHHNMKHVFFATLLFLSSMFSYAKQKETVPPISITWEMGKNGIEPNCFENKFYIKNTGEQTLYGNWVIYYTQMSVTPINEENAPLKIENISSSYNKITPTENFKPLAPGETLIFTCLHKGSILREARAPEGVYIVFKGENGQDQTPQDIPVKILPFIHEYQYKRPIKDFPYADGTYMYNQNALFEQNFKTELTDIFPSIKQINKKSGKSYFTSDINLKWNENFNNEAKLLIKGLKSHFGCTLSNKGKTLVELKHLSGEYPDEYYKIDIQKNRFILSGKTPHAIFNACTTLINILGNANSFPVELSNMQITDYPDTDYRGMMLDVSRNFTKKENIFKLIDYLSTYKMNVLHLHLTDDEGWRIEIDGLEELTKVASRRGHTLDESTCLYPAYAWGWDDSDTTSLANGYYTHNDFVDILKYATKHHIRVIPEVDVPGHSRAAIKAMNSRYKKYIGTDKIKAEEFLLTDFADTSKYVSAQHYNDNVVNVAMPSTYRFVEKVIDEINKMYNDAGLRLTTLHIGGDEVPHGAWEGSLVCQKFMKEKKMTNARELKDYFIEQIIPLLKKHGIQPAGWEEVVLKSDNNANEYFKKSNILSYCWNTVPEWKGDEKPYKLANAGYPVILCNVTNFYMDMSYCNHQQENGLNWGGYVDEYNSFDMLPYHIYKSVRKNLQGEPIDIYAADKNKTSLNKEAYPQIKGLQGELWSETIRNFNQIEYYLFPKMFGLVERAWNTQPSWAFDKDDKSYEKAKIAYNAKIATYELPRLAKKRVNFRVSAPGIIVRNGILYANTAIPNAEIHYTVDGSEPTELSPIWTKPIACNYKQIKAKSYYLGKSSITILLNTD